MDANTLFQNGSVWLRADFHLHTKADKEFIYNGKENYFVNTYVNKLVEQDIRIGVITNHNKFDKGEFVAFKKNAKEKGIGLFPGIEFSLKEGIHILIVFDDAWYKGDTDNINEFLQTAFYSVPNYDMPPYPNSTCDLVTTVEKLDEIGYNYFIILAHVDDTNGLNKALQGRTREAFIQHHSFDKVLAIQKSGNLERYNSLCQFAGREVACVEGSDNAQQGINDIGEGRVTYLKIGDFNFDALQYALLEYKNRVRPKDKPQIHNSWIKSLSFQGGLLNGQQLFFSPELNSLIGIRGSGKSTILEIVRYALNIPFGSQAVDKDYKDDLIQHVLKSGGNAIVEIVDRHGTIYKVKRIYGQKEDIYKDDVLQQGITLDAILQQPIYFGQKDLSNKNADFENDLVNKLIGSRLNNVQARIDNQKKTIQKIINELKSFANLSQLKKETEIVKANAEYKLNLFKEKGVAEKLQLQTSFESDINCLQNFKTGIDAFLNDLQEIIQSHEYSINRDFESKTNPEIFEEAKILAGNFKIVFGQIKTAYSDVQKVGTEFAAVIDKLEEKKENLKEDFARIKRDIDIPELNPDDFIKINREFEISKLKLIEIERLEGQRTELKQLLNEEVNALENLRYEQFTLLQEEVNKINKVGRKLFIEVNYKGRKDKFLVKLQETFRGTHISETTYAAISNDYIDFMEMWKDNFNKLSNRLTEKQLIEVKHRFNANLYDMLTYKVENRIIINFEGTPLKKHSLGQRASALILFLLSQKENDILMIDQPEDDLDNQTIYEDVIQEIKRLKGNMQFIFATHNANIPVLGDSEMLVACEYIDGKEIKLEKGSIDRQPIQEKIINIMEGGKKAFDIRKNIYKIWEATNL
jgi:ABC-type lipoprotein export system ATPase subunit